MSGIQSVVRDKAGNAIASATVSVFVAGTTTAASIFSDPQLTQPQVNPFIADPSGFYSFYAAAGIYDLQYEKAGFPTVLLTEVELALGSLGGTINGNVIINGNLTVTGTITGSIDHSTLLNLASDDHLQYLNRDGSRPMTGDLDVGENDVIGATRVTGPDTGGAARSGLSMSEGVAPELRLDFNEANLAGSPQVLLSTDGVNFDATIRAQGAADLQIGDNLDMNGNAIKELLDPVADQDAATKAYVDANAWQVSLSVLQNIPDAAPTKVLFDTIDFDDGSGITLNAGTVRLAIDGLWVFGASISFDASAVGQRKATIFESVLPTFDVLGFMIAPAATQPGSSTGFSFPARPYQVTGPQFFDINVFQDSGGPLNLDGGPALNVVFWGHRLRP